MRSTNTIRILFAATALFALAINASAFNYLVESRSGGKHYGQYSDNFTGTTDSSAKSTATNPNVTPGIGSRFTTKINETAVFRFKPLATGSYKAYVTWGTSTSGGRATICTVNYEGGSQATTLIQESDNANPSPGMNAWQLLGTHPLNRGTEYTVTLRQTTDSQRVMSDTIRWEIIGSCYDVAQVSPKPPAAPGDMTVTVQGVDVTATEVRVYEYDPTVTPETNTPIGSGPNDADGGDVVVTLTSAVKSTHQLKAAQVVGGIESCLPFTGMEITCDQIPVVEPKAVLVSGDASVVVSGVRADAAAVYVYRDNAGTPALIGTKSAPTGGGDVAVNLDAGVTLQAGWRVYATQKLGTLEGCTTPMPPSLVVDDPNQVGLANVSGMVDAGRTKVWVIGVDPAATEVKVYLANGTEIGVNTSPTSPKTAVSVNSAQMTAGANIKATQKVRIHGNVASAPTRRVTAAWVVEDFQGTVTHGADLLHPAERVWYDTAWNTWTDANFGTGFLSSKCMRILDGGARAGVYAVFENIIPADAAPGQEYHLQAEMLIDEQTLDGNAAPDTNQINEYQYGVMVNGAHPSGTNWDVGTFSLTGRYTGAMTAGKDGLGTGEGSYQILCATITANPGDSLLIGVESPSLAVPTGGRAGMLVDNIRLNVGPKPCMPSDVPQVGVEPAAADKLFEAGQMEVKVTGADVNASEVSVYEYTPPPSEAWRLLGEAPGGSINVLVSLDEPLVAHKVIVATQTLSVCSPPQVMEGEKLAKAFPVVGTKKNTAMKVSLGIRETNNASPCVLGTDGGGTGNIEWIGASGMISTAPQGKDLPPSHEWQTITFYPVDPDGAGPPTADPIRGAFGTGDGALNGACGVLEHLALAATGGNGGSYTLYIDNIKSGETVVEDFESRIAGERVVFQYPAFSGTTDDFLMGLVVGNTTTPSTSIPNVAEVVSTTGDGGGKSLKVHFQFRDELNSRWVRLTTAASGTADALVNLRPNPIVDLQQPISMRILLQGAVCNDPFADADGDEDVDHADFAAFQTCYTGPGGPMIAGCDCYDHDSDNDVDSDDAGSFETCASGPGVAANPGCDG